MLGIAVASTEKVSIPTLVLFFFCLVIRPAVADEVDWDGGAGDLFWYSSDNWSTDALPEPNDEVTLPGNTGLVLLDSAEIRDLIIEDPNSGLKIGNTLQLSGSASVLRNVSFPGAGGRTLLTTGSVVFEGRSQVCLQGQDHQVPHHLDEFVTGHRLPRFGRRLQLE